MIRLIHKFFEHRRVNPFERGTLVCEAEVSFYKGGPPLTDVERKVVWEKLRAAFWHSLLTVNLLNMLSVLRSMIRFVQSSK